MYYISIYKFKEVLISLYFEGNIYHFQNLVIVVHLRIIIHPYTN